MHEGRPFLALELVEGMSAAEALQRARERRTPVPHAVALAIAVDVARALHHAHTAEGDDGRPLRIVHRDVKPSNVLLSWTGDVKLTDFGIARAEGRVSKTTEGFTRGTPDYMAPEQVASSHVDARTDVFGLGCTLATLLTGKSPLHDRDAVVRLLGGAPLPLGPSLDRDVRALLDRALAPRPSDRHPTALAFAEQAAEAMARRLVRDARGEVATFVTALRDGAAPPVPDPVEVEEARRAPRAEGRLRDRTRTFALAASATVGLGTVFVLGMVAAGRWIRAIPLAAVDASPELDAAPTAAPAPITEEAVGDAGPEDARVARASPVTSTATRPGRLLPSWMSERREGRDCWCVLEAPGSPHWNEAVCRELIDPPRCACWYPSVADRASRELVCLEPLDAGRCPRWNTPGKDGAACQGYRRGTGAPTTGELGCNRCMNWPTGTQTAPCTGFDESTGAARSGYLRCD